MRGTKLPRAGSDDSRIDLTPMLDVVFILLIFFVVTATFIRETGIEAGRGEASPDRQSAEVILVSIDASDEYRINDRSVGPAALRANLIQLHSTDPEFPVVIQPHRSSSVQALVTAIDAANAADIDDVAIAE